MKYLRKNDCIMLVFSVVLFAVLQLLITERILSSFWQLNLLIIGINIILAASLNLINGYTGQFSLGHAGFMAVGAAGPRRDHPHRHHEHPVRRRRGRL